MLPEYDIVITDTSCLILFNKIEELSLLKSLGRNIYITEIIKEEFGNQLPDWIKVKSPGDRHYQNILSMDLDLGEASAIALSFEFEDPVLIIDDLKARKIAEKLSLRFSGTFGLLLKAKQIGLIDSVKPILEKIKATNFRFSEQLFETILNEAGE